MPEFTDGNSIRKHLRDSLKSGRTWVFVTDCAEGHRRMAALAVSLWAQRISLGINDNNLGCGITEFCNLATAQSCLISFLTVPKAALRWEDVRSFALSINPEIANAPDEQPDIIVLVGENSENKEMLSAFVTAAYGGQFQILGEAGNN